MQVPMTPALLPTNPCCTSTAVETPASRSCCAGIFKDARLLLLLMFPAKCLQLPQHSFLHGAVSTAGRCCPLLQLLYLTVKG
jgi:hypothetical protein